MDSGVLAKEGKLLLFTHDCKLATTDRAWHATSQRGRVNRLCCSHSTAVSRHQHSVRTCVRSYRQQQYAAAGANYTPASKDASGSTCTSSQVVANAWAVGVAIAAMVPLTLLQTCRQWNLLVAAHCTVLDVVVQVTTSLLLVTEWTRHLQSSCLLDASLQQPPSVCQYHCSTGCRHSHIHIHTLTWNFMEAGKNLPPHILHTIARRCMVAACLLWLLVSVTTRTIFAARHLCATLTPPLVYRSHSTGKGCGILHYLVNYWFAIMASV